MIKKIYNIESNYNFLESFYRFFEINYINKKSPYLISQTKIFLPSKRSCRILAEIFIKNHSKSNSQKNFFLPKIRSIADLSIEDFFDLNLNKNDIEIVKEISKIKAQSDIENIFFLAQEIKKINNFGNLDEINSIQIAKNLKNLFDEIDRENIDLKILAEIDDSDFSRHRQVTIEFLVNFYSFIQNKIIQKNILSFASYQRLICEKFCDILNNQSALEQNPIIIAGSTGSNFISKNLIKSIYHQKNGEVFLYGFADDFYDCENQVSSQFILSSLLSSLNIKISDIEKIRFEELKISDQKQSEFINNSLIPSQKIDKWQKINNQQYSSLDQSKISIFAAKNQIEEAKLISYLVANLVNQKKEYSEFKIGIVVNCQKFTHLLRDYLSKLALNFNDTKSKKLTDLNIIKFLINLLELIESDFDSINLIAIFRSEFFVKNFDHKIIDEFENKIIRKARKITGLAGIIDQLKIADDQNITIFFNDFLTKINPILANDFYQNFSDFYQKICLTIKDLSKINLTAFLENLEVDNQLESLFAYQQKIEKKSASKFCKNIFSEITFFEKTLSSSNIQIVSSIEARLINFDALIIANLNDGLFPAIESENWLGKKIRRELGIDKINQKIGQNFYDFCNYFSANEVILTYSKTIDLNIADKSIILNRIEIFAKKFSINFEKNFIINEFKTDLADQLIKEKNNTKLRSIGVADEENYLSNLAITDVDKLIADPYSIYVKRILKLKKIREIDYRPNNADFGSFVHKILEIYVKNFRENQTNFELKNLSEKKIAAFFDDKKFTSEVEKYFSYYFPQEADLLIWFPKFRKSFTNFLMQDLEIFSKKDWCEIEVRETFNNIEISGKIDRIIINQNNKLEIFDYKTGQTPSIKSVIEGKNPQLTINALMFIKNQKRIIGEAEMKNLNFENISYFAISLKSQKIINMAKNSEETEKLIFEAERGIKNLTEIYSKKNAIFISCLDVADLENYRSDYFHLARIQDLV